MVDPKAIAKKQLRIWLEDPVQFVRDNFQVEPDEWQKDFLFAYNTKQRVAAKACKGPGKTAALAWCCWHFLSTRPNPKIAATSISGDNLRDGLWAEMALWQSKSKFLSVQFTWQKERIFCNEQSETWFMSARTWSQSADKAQQANTLAGLHAERIMFVLDESGGIPDSVMAAAEAALSTGLETKILQCGNPTNLSGPLYRACTSEANLWHVIEITGDPDDPKRSPRISIQWANEQIQKYGRDNPWVLVNVFGKFPPAAFNALLGPDDMKAAYVRNIPPDTYALASKVLGVDVARQGDDMTVIAPRQGLVASRPKVLRKADSQEVAGVVAQAINKFQPDAVFIDATGGWGFGVVDALVCWGYDVTGVQFSSSATNKTYYNKRTEMAFDFAQWIKNGGCLPDIPELTQEATAMTYNFRGDKMLLAEKDHIKEKIGRSPDYFDAYSLTFAYPVQKKLQHKHSAQQALIDYIPYSNQVSPNNNIIADYNPLN